MWAMENNAVQKKYFRTFLSLQNKRYLKGNQEGLNFFKEMVRLRLWKTLKSYEKDH